MSTNANLAPASAMSLAKAKPNPRAAPVIAITLSRMIIEPSPKRTEKICRSVTALHPFVDPLGDFRRQSFLRLAGNEHADVPHRVVKFLHILAADKLLQCL